MKKKKTKRNGFMYCVYTETGEYNKYTDECIKSIQSLKEQIPDASISVYTNASLDELHNVSVIYDANITHTHIAKAYALLDSPYDKTVFIDTDVLVNSANLNAIFDVLTDHTPFAGSPEVRNVWRATEPLKPEMINTGLLGVKKTEYTKKILNEWIDLFHHLFNKRRESKDQVSFRRLMARDFHRFYILPPWFHFRPSLFEKYIRHAFVTHNNRSSTKTSIHDHTDAVRVLIKRLEDYYSELTS